MLIFEVMHGNAPRLNNERSFNKIQSKRTERKSARQASSFARVSFQTVRRLVASVLASSRAFWSLHENTRAIVLSHMRRDSSMFLHLANIRQKMKATMDTQRLAETLVNRSYHFSYDPRQSNSWTSPFQDSKRIQQTKSANKVQGCAVNKVDSKGFKVLNTQVIQQTTLVDKQLNSKSTVISVLNPDT